MKTKGYSVTSRPRAFRLRIAWRTLSSDGVPP